MSIQPVRPLSPRPPARVRRIVRIYEDEQAEHDRQVIYTLGAMALLQIVMLGCTIIFLLGLFGVWAIEMEHRARAVEASLLGGADRSQQAPVIVSFPNDTPSATPTPTLQQTVMDTPTRPPPTETRTPTGTLTPITTSTPTDTTTPWPSDTPSATPLPRPTETPSPTVTPSPTPSATAAPTPVCDPSYPSVCIPNVTYDLNCNDVSFRDFVVLPPDPHGFDRDEDGIGCEGQDSG